jgi:hypothetical protein
VTDPVGETPSQDQEDSEGDSGENEGGKDTTSSEELEPEELEPEEDNGESNKSINLNPNFESEMIHKPGSKSILSVYLGP